MFFDIKRSPGSLFIVVGRIVPTKVSYKQTLSWETLKHLGSFKRAAVVR